MRIALPSYQNQTRTPQERKNRGHIPDEHRCKSPQQKISKPNSTIHLRDHLPQSTDTYSRDSRMTQHLQINCDTLTKLSTKNHMITSKDAEKVLTKFSILS